MKYVLAPWEWHADDPAVPDSGVWRQPAGSVGMFDWRPLAAQSRKQVAEGFGFFALSDAAPTPAGATVLQNDLNERLSLQARTEMAAKLNLALADLDTPTLTDNIWRVFTELADPTGSNGTKPLIPNSKNSIDIYLGGHGLIKRESFDRDQHTFVRSALAASYAESPSLTQLRWMSEQFGYKTNEIAAPSGGATIGDTFVDTAETALASHTPTGTGGFSAWVETEGVEFLKIAGATANGTNRIRDAGASVGLADVSRARAEVDLTANHYVQAEVLHDWVNRATDGDRCGVAARYATSADSCWIYMGWFVTNLNEDLFKNSTGTFTQEGTAGTFTKSLPHTFRIEVDGSSIKGLLDSTEEQSITDSTFNTNTRTGICAGNRADAELGSDTNPYMDNFEAGDIAAAGGSARATSIRVNQGLNLGL